MAADPIDKQKRQTLNWDDIIGEDLNFWNSKLFCFLVFLKCISWMSMSHAIVMSVAVSRNDIIFERDYLNDKRKNIISTKDEL